MIARIPSRTLKTGLAVAALAVALAGCPGDKWGFPCKAGVQQGNWITQEQVALLQPGMTREQVRFALGSPTLTSVLHANRWDYPYYFKPGYGDAQERKFTVWFENDRLVRWKATSSPTCSPSRSTRRTSLRPTRKGGKARSAKTRPARRKTEDQRKRDAAAPVSPLNQYLASPATPRTARSNTKDYSHAYRNRRRQRPYGPDADRSRPEHSRRCSLPVALDRQGSASLGQDAGAPLGKQTGAAITDDLDALAQADCLIDFTRPEGTLEHLQACVKHGVKAVIGTTGFDDNGRAAIEVAAQKIGIVFAPNMSVGVNATLKLLDMAARILNAGYDVEVFEAHHRNKVDAPSGTALKMGETIASAWDVALPDVATWSRHGDTGVPQSGTIGFSVLRGGDIVGDHTGVVLRHRRTHRDLAPLVPAAPPTRKARVRAARFLETSTMAWLTTCNPCWASDPAAGRK